MRFVSRLMRPTQQPLIFFFLYLYLRLCLVASTKQLTLRVFIWKNKDVDTENIHKHTFSNTLEHTEIRNLLCKISTTQVGIHCHL